MNRSTSWLLFGVVAGVFAAACARPGEGDILADYEVIPSASAPVPPLAPESSSARATTTTASASASVAAPAAAPAASGSAAPAASGSAAGEKPAPPPEKTFDCGDKGKPDCPMQRWMKGMPSSAAMSGDPAKLARAFQAIGAHPVPGMGSWSSISGTGASLAAGGDFDAAKRQCKACHSRYQSAYHKRMRDMKWP